MNITICCPSYKRPFVETLEYISCCKVYVAEKEYEEYKRANNPNSNIISVPDEIQGNVSRIRNYILDQEFNNNVDVVCIIDDDMQGIYRFDVNFETNFGYKRYKLNENEIIELIEENTSICNELGFRLWGLNCNGDSLGYRHFLPYSFSSVILGPFCCHIKNDIRYDENIPLKEDYDIAIQHLNKYRGILRLNAYNYDCKQSKQKGGCASIRNRRKEKEQFYLLQKKWGTNIVKEDKSNKGKTKKVKQFDYNPIIRVPIRGI